MSPVKSILLGLLTAHTVSAQSMQDCYRVEDIALPKNVPPEVGALALDQRGWLYVALRRGDIFRAPIVSAPQAFRWQHYATGLHNPCGMRVISPRQILVSQMQELTRIIDTDGDGVAETYAVVSAGWGVSGNYHETNALCSDGKNGYYLAIGTASHNGPTFRYVRDAYSAIGRRGRNFSAVRWKGWVLHCNSHGQITSFAKGFRMHNGILLDSKGNLWCGDNQGDWRATTPFYHVRKGNFYGHPSSLVWDSRWPKHKDPLKMPLSEINAMRTRAAVLLPHKEINRSASQPIEIPKNFGPFAGQILLPDNNGTRISRIMLDKVKGEFQGSCTHFINGQGLRSGNNRVVFSADGKSLFVGQTVRGWGKLSEGVQRITWQGKTPFDIQHIRLKPKGFELRLTSDIDARSMDTAKLKVRSFYYEDKWSYGGPQLGKRDEKINRFALAQPWQAELWLDRLEAGRVYHIEIQGLKSTQGQSLANQNFYYTANQVW